MSRDSLAVKIIDRWLAYQTDYAGLVGMQASIRKAGTLIFSKAYGFANSRTLEKYTPAHIGRIASHSKMFTTVLALRLQEAGALNLDDRVIQYLPQLKTHRDKRFQKITLRHLLTHRSGLFRDGTDSPYWELESPFLSSRQLMEEVMGADLIYAPDTRTKYSNIGFSLMGLALEAAGKADYKTLVTRHVLDRLKNRSLFPEFHQDKKIKYAYGHSRKIYAGQRKLFKHTVTDAMCPAAGFCGNTDGTTHFLHTLHHTDILLPQNLRQDLQNVKWPMVNATGEFYGLGTRFSQGGSSLYAGHSGGYPGFTSWTLALTGSDYIFSIIFNTNETIGFNALRTMADIIRKTHSVFTAAEAATAVVSEPLINKWGCNIYVCGKKKALVLPLGGWLPVDESIILERRKDGRYYSDETQGYGSVGEPVEIIPTDGEIRSVKFGSYTAYRIRDYVKRGRKTFV